MARPAHLSAAELNAYLRCTLPPLERLRLGDHLAVCDDCRARLDEERMAEGTRAEIDGHLDADQLAACAEGASAAYIARHLAECSRCRTKVDDLRRFRSGLGRLPEEIEAPARWRIPAAAAVLLAMAGIGWLWMARREHPPAASRETMTREAPLAPAWQQAVDAARATHRLERPEALDRLLAPLAAPMTRPYELARFELAAPVDEVVLTARPAFRWQTVPEASGYVVAVFDLNFELVAESPALPSAEWDPTAPLPSGRILSWQVSARLGDLTIHAPAPPASDARFQVAAPETIAGIQEARRTHPANHWLLAVMCLQAGAFSEAEREIAAIAASEPDAARDLEASLTALRARR